MSNRYAVINKETNVLTNIIVWDGANTNIIPNTEEWVIIPENIDPTPTMGWTYINNEFVSPVANT